MLKGICRQEDLFELGHQLETWTAPLLHELCLMIPIDQLVGIHTLFNMQTFPPHPEIGSSKRSSKVISICTCNVYKDGDKGGVSAGVVK